jgi:hypothetical protein
MAAAGTALEELLLAQVLSAVAGIDINILGNDIHPFAGLQTWATGLENDVSTSINAANAAAAGVTAVQTTVTANSTAIASLSATATANGSGGLAFADLFPTWDVGNYTTFTTGTVAALELIGGQIGLNPVGDITTGDVVALSTTPFQTAAQSVSIVLGAANSAGNTYTAAILCAATTAATFAAALVYNNQILLCSGVRSAGVTTYTVRASATGLTLSTADTVTVQANPQVGGTMLYDALANGAGVASWHDTSGVVPTGSAYRSFGFSSSYNWNGFIGSFGFAVASLTAADLTTPPVVGTGWNLSMAGTSGVALPGSAWQPLAASTLDTQGPVKGVTVTTLGTGVITIQTAGWYVITWCCYLTSAAGTSNAFQTGIYQQATGGAKVLVKEGEQVEGNQVFQVAITAILQCAAGDQISPAVNQAGSNSVIGTATGAITYFSGALVSGAAAA